MKNDLTDHPPITIGARRDAAETPRVYILGCGAIGLTLAAYLAGQGRSVVAVRTSRDDVSAGRISVTVRGGGNDTQTSSVETVSLSRLAALEGIVVVTAKSYANRSIAAALATKSVTGPLVIMQNGVGVEKAFHESEFMQIHRCVLYATAQATPDNDIAFRPIASCPIGTVKGRESSLAACVGALTTPEFPFHAERDIQRDIWKKAIINSVFNSICPLLEIDNGIFARDPEVARLAAEIIDECVILAEHLKIPLTGPELMEQLMKISKGSDGQLISTFQDIRNGRETEIEYLNLELARIASSMTPGINLEKTRFLGDMILAKSRFHRAKNSASQRIK